MLKKNYFLFIFSTLFVFGAMMWNATPAKGQIKTVKPLYQRLGGYDAIAAVVDDFIQRLATDAKLGHFF